MHYFLLCVRDGSLLISKDPWILKQNKLLTLTLVSYQKEIKDDTAEEIITCSLRNQAEDGLFYRNASMADTLTTQAWGGHSSQRRTYYSHLDNWTYWKIFSQYLCLNT